jgi:hypothetical protein
MMTTAAFFLIPLLVIAAVVHRVVKRGYELRRLLEDGVEATGTVTRKRRFRTAHPQLYLHYEYSDPAGDVHQQRSLVPDTVFDAHQEGAIAIVYSASRPSVSAPLYLIEELR